ncbi:MAG: NUDIX domain-containing protein [Cellvibrionales bacterium]|nr:NUDIX domain-containing protein [Cellvibrionales bacterium]
MMKKSLPAFEQSDLSIVSREVKYDGFFKIHKLSLSHALFEGGQSEVFERELCLRNDAVGMLLYDPSLQQLAMVEQMRIGAIDRNQSPWMLEVVAGMLDKACEAPCDVAIREAKEEANLSVDAIEPMLDYFVSPGGSTEFFSLFVGKVSLSDVKGGVFGLAQENEDIRLHILSVDEVFALLKQGQINNAMTLIALQWFALNKVNIDAKWQ